VSPRALRHRAHHPPGKGSGVATCLEAPSTPPTRKGLQCHHVPQGTERATHKERAPVSSRAPRHLDHRPTGLRYRHMSCGSRPASWCGRASEPPRAQWPSAPRSARAFPRRLTSDSSWPRLARGANIALNVYVTGHTQCMSCIKCIQDIDTAGR
jgi:hypothetical protein